MSLLKKLCRDYPDRFTKLIDFNIKRNSAEEIEYSIVVELGKCDLKSLSN